MIKYYIEMNELFKKIRTVFLCLIVLFFAVSILEIHHIYSDEDTDEIDYGVLFSIISVEKKKER